jgi:hypothetical protein
MLTAEQRMLTWVAGKFRKFAWGLGMGREWLREEKTGLEAKLGIVYYLLNNV